MSVLEIENLRVELTSTGDYIIDDFDLSADTGQIVAIVGESGSGKTTTGTALLGYARRGARIAGGSVRIAGTQVVPGAEATLRGQRGRLVSYIHQDPSMALNPALRIGTQIAETLAAHEPAMSRAARDARVDALLQDVRLPATAEFRARFPHQLSGGQLQRICMAMAIACKPRVLVLDEPTTGLDVTTQAHVLETLQRLVREHDMVAIYVTHDLSVVSEIADSVIVMYSGLICEQGSRDAIFGNPAHPYTRRLLAAVPDLGTPRQLEVIAGAAPSPAARPTGCSFAPRCRLATEACVAAQPDASEVAPGHPIRCIRPEAAAQIPLGCAAAPQPAPAQPQPVLTVRNLRVAYGRHTVLHDVSFDLNRGECLAVVGESGSGKTTLSRTLVGLVQPAAGTVHFKGTALPGDVSRTPETVRREMQYVFQSAFTALNPRRTIEASLTTPLRHFFGHRGAPARERILRALDKVALSPRVLELYPGQLSGGERQRVAIARALVCEPEVLLCDEITSALDVSVQAAIVELLQELRRSGDLSLLFVTHDLGLVRTIADRVLVLNRGEIVAAGPTGEVIDHPQDDYTRLLMGNTPRLDFPAMAKDRAASA